MIRAFHLLQTIDTQRAFVTEIEAERAIVGGNCDLIARMGMKLQTTLARVLGEGESDPAEARAMEEAAELGNYLPLSFKSPRERE